MNFEIICPSCGAPSSPTIGVCPYCKAVMTTEAEKKSPVITNIKKAFNDGNLEQALSLAKALETKKPDSLSNVEFVLLYTQILIEVDGPSSRIKSLLNHALAENPSDSRLLDYLEIIEAESNLSHDKDDAGEVALANIIRRFPENVHALFSLGSHLFWVEKDYQRALRYLEQCVRLRPNFIKAKACLAAVYKELGRNDFAVRLFKECAAKTHDSTIKGIFTDLAETASEK
jgi:predicted Zn-dependent protease